MELNIKCPHCHEDVIIEIEVDSPSDYNFDNNCPQCGVTFTPSIADEVCEEVNDEYVSRAEFYNDCMEDR